MTTNVLDLKNKVITITGASTGIGKATAITLAKAGATIVVADINEQAATQTLQEVKEYSPNSIFIAVNVADEAQVKNFVETTIEKFGRIDASFNNAGILAPPTVIDNYDTELFDRVMSVDAKGVFLCMKYQLKYMVKAGKGTILNTASVAGLFPEGGMAAYVAAKHAVIGLTKTAAIENAGLGIRVNALAPGWVRTPMTTAWDEDKDFNAELRAAAPTHRGAEPQEVANLAHFLLSDAAPYCTGQTYLIDGAQTSRGLLPFDR